MNWAFKEESFRFCFILVFVQIGLIYSNVDYLSFKFGALILILGLFIYQFPISEKRKILDRILLRVVESPLTLAHMLLAVGFGVMTKNMYIFIFGLSIVVLFHCFLSNRNERNQLSFFPKLNKGVSEFNYTKSPKKSAKHKAMIFGFGLLTLLFTYFFQLKSSFSIKPETVLYLSLGITVVWGVVLGVSSSQIFRMKQKID